MSEKPTPTPKPKSLEIIGEEILALVWEDAHESFFAGKELREHCPCAECRTRRLRGDAGPAGAAASPGTTLQLLPRSAFPMAPPRLVGMEQIGRYAVRLRWSDGHSAGIYEFRFLRSLCPCDGCSAGGHGAPGPPAVPGGPQ